MVAVTAEIQRIPPPPELYIVQGELSVPESEPHTVTFAEFFPYLLPSQRSMPNNGGVFGRLDFGSTIASYWPRVYEHSNNNLVYMYSQKGRSTFFQRGDMMRANAKGGAEALGALICDSTDYQLDFTDPIDSGQYRSVNWNLKPILDRGYYALIVGHTHPDHPDLAKEECASNEDIEILFTGTTKSIMILGQEEGRRWQKFIAVTDETPPPGDTEAKKIISDSKEQLRTLEWQLYEKTKVNGRVSDEARKVLFADIEKLRKETEIYLLNALSLYAGWSDNMRYFDELAIAA